jgi:proteic killer suppression protein
MPLPYTATVIRSFRSKALRRFAERGDASKLSVQNPDRIRRILLALDVAKLPDQMNVPGLRFHPLKGRDKGRYAVDASGNWRVTFAWDGEDAVDVDLEDYH